MNTCYYCRQRENTFDLQTDVKACLRCIKEYGLKTLILDDYFLSNKKVMEELLK